MTERRKKKPEEAETGTDAGFDFVPPKGDLKEAADAGAPTRIDGTESHVFFSFTGQLAGETATGTGIGGGTAPPPPAAPAPPPPAPEAAPAAAPVAPAAEPPAPAPAPEATLPHTSTKTDDLRDVRDALRASTSTSTRTPTSAMIGAPPPRPRAPEAPPPAGLPAPQDPVPAAPPVREAEAAPLTETFTEGNPQEPETREIREGSASFVATDHPTETDLFGTHRPADEATESLAAPEVVEAAEAEEEAAGDATATVHVPFFRRVRGWFARLLPKRFSEEQVEQALETVPPEETDSSLLDSLQRMPAEKAEDEAAAGTPAPEPGPEAPARAPRTPLRERASAAAARLRSLLVSFLITGKKEAREKREQKSGAWWRRTLTEIGALFLLIVPLELVLSGGRIGSFRIHPHPYWLVVLPMAGARGAVAGLVSAAVASLLYAVGAMQALSKSDLLSLLELRSMLEPLLFFGVGFFIGELHDEFAGRHRKLQRTLDDVQERNRRLRHERDVLGDANKLLEKRIVDHSVQFGNLILAATRIETAGRREIFEVALDMVEEHCGATGSVLLVVGRGGLDLVAHRGWPDEEGARRIADARGSALVKEALAKGTAANGLAAEATPPKRGPLVVAPLFDSAGVAKALLCLDDVPPARLNEATVSLFLAIAEWTSASLGRVTRAAAERDRRIETSAGDGAAYIGSAEELGERLRLEYERCARYGVPTSVLGIQATEWTDTSLEGIDRLDRHVRSVFTGGLRPSDALYRFGYPGCYLLVLAGTAIEGAEVVKARLLRRVDYTPDSGVGAIDLFASGPDAEAPDLMTLAGRIAARFRTASRLPLQGACPVPVPDRNRIGAIDHFARRVRMETSLAVRNGFELHVVGVTAEVESAASAGLLARHIEEVGVDILRPTDGLYAVGPHHCAVVLPCTGEEEAAAAAHRLVLAVRRRDPDAMYGHLETQVLALGPNHPDGLSFLEALARKRPLKAVDPDAETDS